MNLRRLLPLFALALTLCITGCATYYTNNIFTRNRYYRTVRVTDLEGNLIADWTAEGYVWPHGKGYRFSAIERVSGGPIPVTTRYPHGRKVRVDGPNIVVMPREKPEWLIKIEGF